MERDFYNEEIEHLVKQKADQYRMYPSDRVWKGINRTLHTRRKWYLLSFLLFLASISYYAIVELIAPATGNTEPGVKASQVPQPAQQPATQKAAVIPFVNSNNNNTASSGPMAALSPAAGSTAGHADENSHVTITGETTDVNTEMVAYETPVYDIHTRRKLANPLPFESGQFLSDNNSGITQNIQQPSVAINPEVTIASNETALINVLTPINETTIVQEDKEQQQWLENTAAYELSVPKTRRLGWQLSFAPTVNYRQLTGSPKGKPGLSNNIPVANEIDGDPDKLVNHNPAIGFELGSHMIYTMNKNLGLRFGLQFNYSRYDIQAYSSGRPELATIELNSSNNFTRDYLTSYTRIRNFGGDEVEQLQNQYYQLSIPLGIEYRILGNEKIQLGVAGTFQPTYLLNRNTYLITTDFKNYTQEPSLVRRWNAFASMETYISYKTGELRWQVGPQFRKQLFSSYVKEYPLREHLMEFGIKIGVTKTIR